MNSFIRIEKRGNSFFAYKVTPSYDPKTQNTKAKKRYLGTVTGHNPDGSPIISRRWKKKTQLEKLLSTCNYQREDTKSLVDSLFFNKAYVPSCKANFIDNIKIPGRVNEDFLYYYVYSSKTKRYYELFIHKQISSSYFINIDTMMKGMNLRSKPILVNVSDAQDIYESLPDRKIIIVRDTLAPDNTTPIQAANKYVYYSPSIDKLSISIRSILSVVLFYLIVKKIETRDDIDATICKGFEELVGILINQSNSEIKIYIDDFYKFQSEKQ